jgi:hypothetical protein
MAAGARGWSRSMISFLLAILGNLLGDELSGWLPRFSVWLTKRNARGLPVEIADRMEEEWLAHLEEMPGPLSKFLFAIDLFRASRQLRHELGHTVSALATRATRMRDRVLGVIGFAFLAPAFGFIYFLVRLERGRGRIFEWSRTTMPSGRMMMVGRIRTVDEKGHSTAIGRFLERTRLDMVPRLLDLAAGDITYADIKGPLPLRSVLLHLLTVPGYREAAPRPETPDSSSRAGGAD